MNSAAPTTERPLPGAVSALSHCTELVAFGVVPAIALWAVARTTATNWLVRGSEAPGQRA